MSENETSSSLLTPTSALKVSTGNVETPHEYTTMFDQMHDSLRATASPESSSLEPSMYESPSPPSSASSSGFAEYGAVRHRPRSSKTGSFDAHRLPAHDRVQLQRDSLRDISPIQQHSTDRQPDIPYSDLPSAPADPARTRAATAEKLNQSIWEGTRFVPVLADETTRLIPSAENDSLTGADAILSQTRADLEQARLAASRQQNRREPPASPQDRYILGCSLLMMTSVVFMIIVSGVTTILAHRNLLQLEISSDWVNGAQIPMKYGCHAKDGFPISFPLRWKNAPKQATNLVILFANPGVIKQLHYDPIHWFITDIPLNGNSDGFLPANASANPELMPPGTKIRANSRFSDGRYWAPCAVNGTSFFVMHVYAIEANSLLEDIKDAREVMNRFVGVPVARLTGMYGKVSKKSTKGSAESAQEEEEALEEESVIDQLVGSNAGDQHGIFQAEIDGSAA